MPKFLYPISIIIQYSTNHETVECEFKMVFICFYMKNRGLLQDSKVLVRDQEGKRG